LDRTARTKPPALEKGAPPPPPANLLLNQGRILQSMLFNYSIKIYGGVAVRLHTFINYIRVVASYRGQIISEGWHVCTLWLVGGVGHRSRLDALELVSNPVQGWPRRGGHSAWKLIEELTAPRRKNKLLQKLNVDPRNWAESLDVSNQVLSHPIHSLVFSPRGRSGRSQSPVMEPTWLLAHTAS